MVQGDGILFKYDLSLKFMGIARRFSLDQQENPAMRATTWSNNC